MAKKTVATLKKEGGIAYIKAIRTIKSPKSGAYTFREEILPEPEVKDFFNKK